jgi:hypothetical protein
MTENFSHLAKMKTDWYLKLCQSTLPEQKDLIEHKCGTESTRLHMNYTYWFVGREDSM